MCLAVLCLGRFPAWPLFLASNRDEFRDRPSLPPRVERRQGISVLAPRDARAGGTWIGVNDRGLVALLTNRSDLPSPRREGRSRGVLVWEALAAPTLRAARARLEVCRAEVTAPYQLLLADAASSQVLVHEGNGELDELQPVDYPVILSDRADGRDPSPPVVKRARVLWERLLVTPAADPWSAARRLLVDGNSPDADSICRSGAERGTVSASIIGVGLRTVRFDHAAGPPTTTPFETQHLELAREAP